MDLTSWTMFVLVEAALCLTPGPAVLYVFSVGARYGAKTSFSANAGVVAGNSFYFVLSALGLSAVLLASHTVFLAIKWAGVVYLTWLGLKFIWEAKGGTPSVMAAPPAAKIFRGGVVLQLANPKSFVFFGAILPQFVDPNGNIWLQFLILGVTSQVIEAVVLGMYGVTADRSAALFRTPLFVRWVDGLSGSLLIVMAAWLAAFRRA